MNKEKLLDDNGNEITEEYIIISKTNLQKRIEQLEELNTEPAIGGIMVLKEILSQSTPLIPEIEKAIDKGYDFAKQTLYRSDGSLQPKIEDYISNLKLDI